MLNEKTISPNVQNRVCELTARQLNEQMVNKYMGHQVNHAKAIGLFGKGRQASGSVYVSCE